MFAVPETYAFAFRAWYKLLFFTLSRSAKKPSTVSSFSQRELARYCKVPASSFTVLPEGAEHTHNVAADTQILERHGLTQRAFILAVGSQSPHKNFQGLVKALQFLGTTSFDVVVAGGTHASAL